MMCRVLKVHPSGFYKWLTTPVSQAEQSNERLLGLIRHSWLESGCVYGSPRIHAELREHGEVCSLNRVARLMKGAGIKAVLGYKRRYGTYPKPAVVAANRLQQVFTAQKPNQCWVTDITYIRTYEGWLYLCVVIDLYSRAVIGWSMSRKISASIVIHALLMAVFRRKPSQEVIVHSDQGVQYTSETCQKFMQAHQLVSSMSRRGNCYDNAACESFFHSLKTERVKKRIYKTRAEAKSDLFDYIEIFYNRKRRHSFNNMIAPIQFENKKYPGMHLY